MKKLALILALMIIPCTAFGLEMLNDSTMDNVTGQAGVAIAMDDIQIFMNIEKLAWIDCDGFNSFEGKGTCNGAGGAIVLNNFQLDVLNINAIVGATTVGTLNNGIQLHSVSCGFIDLFYNYATSAQGDGCQLRAVGGPLQNLGLNNYHGADGTNYEFTPHFLTIDVTDRLPASTEGLRYWANHSWSSPSTAAANADTASTIGGVLIGIPTAEFYINSMFFTPMYDGDLASHSSEAYNDNDNVINGDFVDGPATFGTVYMEGITFTTLGGWIEISPK
jgi:hypothetical protein